MPALNDALSDFARAIVQGAELAPGGHGAGLGYPVATAVAVYRNNYRGNLHDALAGAYPVVEQLVGNDFFRRMTREFIAQHPSRSGNLHRYGSEMAAFVAAFEPAQELVYLADVAALEWAAHCAYFADDAATLDLARLAQIPPENYADLILHAHPASRLVRSTYPVAAIWNAHQPGAPDDFRIDLDSGPCVALVSREDDVIVVSELTQAAADWLQALQAGTTLGDATVATLERHPDFDVQAALLDLITHGVLGDCS